METENENPGGFRRDLDQILKKFANSREESIQAFLDTERESLPFLTKGICSESEELRLAAARMLESVPGINQKIGAYLNDCLCVGEKLRFVQCHPDPYLVWTTTPDCQDEEARRRAQDLPKINPSFTLKSASGASALVSPISICLIPECSRFHCGKRWIGVGGETADLQISAVEYFASCYVIRMFDSSWAIFNVQRPTQVDGVNVKERTRHQLRCGSRIALSEIQCEFVTPGRLFDILC